MKSHGEFLKLHGESHGESHGCPIRVASLHQALSITPMTGVVGPDSSVTIHVNFKPLEVQQMGREFSG